MTNQDIDAPVAAPRRRAQAYGRRETLAARKLVVQTQAKLGGWHSQLARLRAAAQRKPADSHLAREQAATLLPLVVAERIEIERLTEEAGEGIAETSIVRDIMRALMLLRLQLEGIANADEPPSRTN